MNEWVKNLTGVLLVSSVAVQLLPDQKYEQYLKLFLGFFLLILILQPVLKIGSADSYLEEKINAFVQEQERMEEQIVSQGEAFAAETEERQEMPAEIEPVEDITVEVELND